MKNGYNFFLHVTVNGSNYKISLFFFHKKIFTCPVHSQTYKIAQVYRMKSRARHIYFIEQLTMQKK